MFGFGKKRKAEKAEIVEQKPVEQVTSEKPQLLEMKNIILDCKAKPKEEVIREMGKILYESGYVNESYAEAMIQREFSFPTNIGNGIALPHGVEEAKKDIKRSGIAVMVFPEGTNWGTEDVKLVIGIAGVGEDHLEILSIIAEKMAELDAVERVVASTKEEIYRTFTEKGDVA